MNDYMITTVHPEFGEHDRIPAQGANALEALENAVGSGTANTYGIAMTAYVKNIITGFVIKLEYMID